MCGFHLGLESTASLNRIILPGINGAILPHGRSKSGDMPAIELEHFRRAAIDVGAHGDNDTLPFDIDSRFIKERMEDLAKLAFVFAQELAKGNRKTSKNAVDALHIFSERLLAPTGLAGFRVTTKIHPFWNIYFNGVGVAIAEALEPKRSNRAHSYRFESRGEHLFNKDASWRAFRESTITDCEQSPDGSFVVQTDISSFYEHVSHHRIENAIDDLFPTDETVAPQIERLLSKFASGRSFGLPVGSQASRILAELLLSQVDRQLTDAGITWRRYVDDFVIVTATQADAYRGLSVLANSLADYGLTLNRTKTTLLSTKHYVDYVRTQLRGSGGEAGKLVEIDLHFDPYSDNPEADYIELKEIVASLDVRALLDLELEKAQPDTFLVSQISRTLRLHSPNAALDLCRTLLSPRNLHAFRASWPTIMRGVSQVLANDALREIFDGLDFLLDEIPHHSSHLLTAEVSCLHYLRAIRFRRTEARAQYVLRVHSSTSSQTVRRACIDCWKNWADRPSFTRERNRWNALQPEEQRMLWLAAAEFGDEGDKFRRQVRKSAPHLWQLGIERANQQTFTSIYMNWGG